jgi:hypothetical protein
VVKEREGLLVELAAHARYSNDTGFVVCAGGRMFEWLVVAEDYVVVADFEEGRPDRVADFSRELEQAHEVTGEWILGDAFAIVWTGLHNAVQDTGASGDFVVDHVADFGREGEEGGIEFVLSNTIVCN